MNKIFTADNVEDILKQIKESKILNDHFYNQFSLSLIKHESYKKKRTIKVEYDIKKEVFHIS